MEELLRQLGRAERVGDLARHMGRADASVPHLSRTRGPQGEKLPRCLEGPRHEVDGVAGPPQEPPTLGHRVPYERRFVLSGQLHQQERASAGKRRGRLSLRYLHGCAWGSAAAVRERLERWSGAASWERSANAKNMPKLACGSGRSTRGTQGVLEPSSPGVQEGRGDESAAGFKGRRSGGVQRGGVLLEFWKAQYLHHLDMEVLGPGGGRRRMAVVSH